MVQINLLPDTRKEKLKDKNNRQLATSVATVSIVGSVAGLILLLVITQAQRFQISMLTSSINNTQNKIQSDIPNATVIATAQQHMDTLNTLYEGQVRVSKFLDLLEKVTTKDVGITSISLDPNNKLVISGSAVNYYAASKFAKALEESNITIGANASPSNTPNFSNTFLPTLGGSQGKVTFSITANLAPGVTNGK